MCTKAVSVNPRKLADRFQANVIIRNESSMSEEAVIEQISKDDVLPTDLSAVITLDRPREIQFMRWGLIPSFAKDPRDYSAMYNARAETLLEKASFKDLLMASRCLILTDGFYENETQGDERVQWQINPAKEANFFKAGLWTTWRNPQNGQIVESFTMITCDPQQTEFAKIHDRIPIIMTQPERRLWMNPQASKEELLALLKPCDASMYTISEFSRKPLKAPKSKSKGAQGDFFF